MVHLKTCKLSAYPLLKCCVSDLFLRLSLFSEQANQFTLLQNTKKILKEVKPKAVVEYWGAVTKIWIIHHYKTVNGLGVGTPSAMTKPRRDGGAIVVPRQLGSSRISPHHQPCPVCLPRHLPHQSVIPETNVSTASTSLSSILFVFW